MTQALWTQKGESLSHKNASREFGLDESEIIEAIKVGKLQCKVNYVHGNPYYKLLRKEVKALAIDLRGESHFRKQEIGPPGVKVLNLAFDITPSRYVTAIITEKGVIKSPYKAEIKRIVTF